MKKAHDVRALSPVVLVVFLGGCEVCRPSSFSGRWYCSVRTCTTPPPPARFDCPLRRDGGPGDAFVIVRTFDEFQRPDATVDFGCHFEADAGVLFFVQDGRICADPPDPDDDTFRHRSIVERCAPPPGHWFLASGVRTLELDVSDAGIVCR